MFVSREDKLIVGPRGWIQKQVRRKKKRQERQKASKCRPGLNLFGTSDQFPGRQFFHT